MFSKKGVLKNFWKFAGKHLCQSLFLNKVADLRSATLFKEHSITGVFPWNFKSIFFYRTPLVAASEVKQPLQVFIAENKSHDICHLQEWCRFFVSCIYRNYGEHSNIDTKIQTNLNRVQDKKIYAFLQNWSIH